MNKVKSIFRSLTVGAAVLSVGSVAYAQQSFGGQPRSFSSASLRSAGAEQELRVQNVPLNFNVDDELSRASWTAARQGVAPRIGKVINSEISFTESAQLVATEGNTNIYRMMVSTEGTPSGVVFYYKDFFIPQGGKLYIYDVDQKQILGAYTYETHPQHGAFATEPLSTNTVVFEYEAPAGVEMPSIEIEGLGYMYAAVPFRALGESIDASDPYLSKACQINVNCVEGNDWQTEKAGIVALIQKIPGTGYNSYDMSACSGNVLNNTNVDFKPYVISAAHCAGEGMDFKPTEGKWKGDFKIPETIMDQWIFGFHYEKPRCSNGSYATYNMKSLVGCRIRSYLPIHGYSDGMLLELTKNIPEDYRVYYNGFDATPQLPKRGVGIHHPASDSKKISTYGDGSEMNYSRWVTTSSSGGETDHFKFKFTAGQTEGGSSGSSLFNEEKLVVGTLTGGETIPCLGANWYGRLSSHWDKYKGTGKGLKYDNMATFLDPKDQGKTKKLQGTWRNGYMPLLTIKGVDATITEAGKKVTLKWDALPKHSQGYETSYLVYRDDVQLTETKDSTYTDNLTQEIIAKGATRYSVVPQYKIGDKYEKTAPAFAAVYVAPVEKEAHNVKVTAASKGGVQITWDPVINGQTISKNKNESKRFATVNSISSTVPSDKIEKIWIADTWRTESYPAEDIYLSQVNFVPAKAGVDVNLVIYQKGMNPVVERVSIPDWASGSDYFRYALKKPIKINNKQNLVVGFEMTPSTAGYDIRQFSGNKDDHFETDGARLIFVVKSQSSREPNQTVDYTKAWENWESRGRKGYLAMELMFTNVATPLIYPWEGTWTRAQYPGTFPKVKGYKVFKGNTLVKQVENVRYTEDESGSTSDKYRVEAIYDYPEYLGTEEIKLANKEVYAYPAVFGNTLNINRTDLVKEVKIYDVQGRLMLTRSADALSQAINTQTLAAGTYMVVLKTDNGTISQKVVKQ
ncbi:MAG: T9SS type A sorting domain-containing protein [Porphyromonas sp.]|nr:T9SS type A sorting domain-containing protein [Porphyromonas sp.]